MKIFHRATNRASQDIDITTLTIGNNTIKQMFTIDKLRKCDKLNPTRSF